MIHRTLLGVVLLLGSAAGTAGAQAASYDASQGSGPQGYSQPGHEAQGHEPSSTRASNIDRGDTRSDIAPSLPAPQVGPEADARQYLMAAQQAIAARRTGMAQEALERAESRLLDRSVPQGQTNAPDENSAVSQISAARHSLASGDLVTASNTVQSVLSGMGGPPTLGQPIGSTAVPPTARIQ